MSAPDFLDTNVLVYAYDAGDARKRRERAHSARDRFQHAAVDRVRFRDNQTIGHRHLL